MMFAILHGFKDCYECSVQRNFDVTYLKGGVGGSFDRRVFQSHRPLQNPDCKGRVN